MLSSKIFSYHFTSFRTLNNLNARAFLIALSEYMDVRNVPPNLRLVVIKRSLKGPAVTSSCVATFDAVNTFEDFQREFSSHYLNENIQTEVRVDICKARYSVRGRLFTGVSCESKYL